MMFRTTSLILVFVLTLLALPWMPVAATAYQSEASADEYAVYDAVIGDLYAGHKVTGGKVASTILLIDEHTFKYPFKVDPRVFETASDSATTLADYETKNKNPGVLKRSFNIDLDYLINSAETKWTAPELQGKQVDHVSLSRVGFNPNRTEALVLLSYTCGGLCGHGAILFLTRTDNRWTVKARLGLWEN